MKKYKLSILIIMCTAVFISSVGVTLAGFGSSSIEENKFQDGKLNIEVTEDFTPPDKWDGFSLQKNVRIKNNSNVNSIIRVTLVPRWVDEKGRPWAGDTSILKYRFSDNLYKGNEKQIPIDSSMWIPCDSDRDNVQYFYYNSILKNGDETENLLEKVSILKEHEKDESVTTGYMPDILDQRYNGKRLIIDVKSEAVLADESAVKAAWGDTSGNSSIDDMIARLCKS